MSQRAKVRKSRFVKDIKQAPEDGRDFRDLFCVVRKTLATSSRGEPYLRLTLGDASGTIDGFVWERAREFEAEAAEGCIVEVEARAQIHRDMPQLRVYWLRQLSAREVEEVDRSQFRPGLSQAERERLWGEIRGLLDSVRTPPLRELLSAFEEDPAFRGGFLEAPAAKSFHHAYVGGLAEHTLATMRLAERFAQLYPERLNRDLLLAGAFLHDLAKVEEFHPTTGDYTDVGRLLGHITIGVALVREKAARVRDFPAPLLLQLQHLILSHHDRPEWGSPVQPQTLEAIALHFADNLDAKLSGAWAWLEGEEVPPGRWSTYWKGLGLQLLRTPGPGPQETESRGSLAEVEAELLRRGEEEDGSEPAASEEGSEPPRPARPAGSGGQRELF